MHADSEQLAVTIIADVLNLDAPTLASLDLGSLGLIPGVYKCLTLWVYSFQFISFRRSHSCSPC